MCQVVDRDLDVQKQKTTGPRANYSREIERIRKGFFIEVGNTWKRNCAFVPEPLIGLPSIEYPLGSLSLTFWLGPQRAYSALTLTKKRISGLTVLDKAGSQVQGLVRSLPRAVGSNLFW
jgi:hypothetical protein